MKRSTILWIAALILTLVSAVWQRLSGPTYPVDVEEQIDGIAVTGELLRTHSTTGPLPVTLTVDDESIGGAVLWRRFPTDGPWQTAPMQRTDSQLQASIPAQPAAGKVEYRLELTGRGGRLILPPGEAVVARFKGDVPAVILVLHIIAIFLGMLWSTRAGMEALARGPAVHRQALVTLVLLAGGGLILGPLIQKYAFGALWTGWPLGEDLTDNKLAVAVLLWLLAVIKSRRARAAGSSAGRWWVVSAALVTLVIFAIPHSIHGSELDYQTMEQVSG